MKNLKKIFGLTKGEASILGARAREFVKKYPTHRSVGSLLLCAFFTFMILTRFVPNIGGQEILSTNVIKPTIDVTTKNSMQNPLQSFIETRGLSIIHTGADLAAPTGTPVKPITLGIVKEVSHDLFGYGNHIVLQHEQGLDSLYGHL
ncbi:M23 family metallopeptidase, partial [Candidatus Microgenomates bacterium]|nr:M23 family metallopeptidase [Candidatus Microgenomates bacterium]